MSGMNQQFQHQMLEKAEEQLNATSELASHQMLSVEQRLTILVCRLVDRVRHLEKTTGVLP